jgi:holo-[acyl-carrier protein] synthase
MILGIGIDIIDIERFTDWHTKSELELLRVFSQEEIAYCLQNPKLSAERFAVRFAAKEAFFKAFQAMLITIKQTPNQSLLSVQKEVSVKHLQNGIPSLLINWNTLLPEQTTYPQSHISLSHATNSAVAMVVLEQAT